MRTPIALVALVLVIALPVLATFFPPQSQFVIHSSYYQ